MRKTESNRLVTESIKNCQRWKDTETKNASQKSSFFNTVQQSSISHLWSQQKIFARILQKSLQITFIDRKGAKNGPFCDNEKALNLALKKKIKVRLKWTKTHLDAKSKLLQVDKLLLSLNIKKIESEFEEKIFLKSTWRFSSKNYRNCFKNGLISQAKSKRKCFENVSSIAYR